MSAPVPSRARARRASRSCRLRRWPGARYAGQLGQRRIRARTLVLHGDADTVVNPRNGKLLASRIAGARLVIFPGLGHLLFWEDPGGFAAAVTSFLLDPDGTGTDGERRRSRQWPAMRSRSPGASERTTMKVTPSGVPGRWELPASPRMTVPGPELRY